MAHLIEGVEVPSVSAFEFLKELYDFREINDSPALAGFAGDGRWSIESLVLYSEELERAGLVGLRRAANPHLWVAHVYPHAFQFAERLPEIRAFLRARCSRLQAPARQSALAQ